MSDKYIEVGKITSPHGIKGEVKVVSFTGNPGDITSYGDLFDKKGNKINIDIVSIHNEKLICKIEGITDRNQAEKIRNTFLFIARNSLPETEEDSFYYEDLINTEARLKDGKIYGIVKAVHNFGAGDIIEIKPANDKETVMVTFNSDNFGEINLKENYLIINKEQND